MSRKRADAMTLAVKWIQLAFPGSTIIDVSTTRDNDQRKDDRNGKQAR